MNKRKPTHTQFQPPVIVDQHLTIAEVAARLQVGKTTVYKLINQEGLPTVTIAGAYRIPASDLNAWLRARKRVRLVS